MDLPFSGAVRWQILVFLFWLVIWFINFNIVILLLLLESTLEVAIPSQNLLESCTFFVFFLSTWISRYSWPSSLLFVELLNISYKIGIVWSWSFLSVAFTRDVAKCQIFQWWIKSTFSKQVTEDLEATFHMADWVPDFKTLAKSLLLHFCIYALVWVLNRNYLPAISYNETSRKTVSRYI